MFSESNDATAEAHVQWANSCAALAADEGICCRAQREPTCEQPPPPLLKWCLMGEAWLRHLESFLDMDTSPHPGLRINIAAAALTGSGHRGIQGSMWVYTYPTVMVYSL